MSAETTRSEILDQYRSTSAKLKKRFLRKPNLTEACESYTALAQHCENEELPPYAGLCHIASARCDGSLGNIPGEAASLMKAARQFMSAEIKTKRLGCASPYNENLQAALSCFTHASSRYQENSPLNICLDLEISESLDKLDLKEYKELHLKDAVEMAVESLDTKIYCIEKLARNYVDNGDYTSALENYTEISNIIDKSPMNGARADILLNCEISRVFLLLILRPAPQKLTQNLAELLEKYTWGDRNDKSLKRCGMSEDLFILLQSLVLTCQSLDTSSLPELEAQMWRRLSLRQRDLLRVLVRVYCC